MGQSHGATFLALRIQLPYIRFRSQATAQQRDQIAQGILLPVQLKNRQAGVGRGPPIALGIIANMQSVARLDLKKFERAPTNFRVGFIGADFARNEDVAEILRDAEALQNHAQAAVEV